MAKNKTAATRMPSSSKRRRRRIAAPDMPRPPVAPSATEPAGPLSRVSWRAIRLSASRSCSDNQDRPDPGSGRAGDLEGKIYEEPFPDPIGGEVLEAEVLE